VERLKMTNKSKTQRAFVQFECDLPVMFTGEADFWDGSSIWYKNGLRHRDDGHPAYIHPDGIVEWWEEERMYQKKFFNGVIKHYVHFGPNPEEVLEERSKLFIKMRRLGFLDKEIIKCLYEQFGPTDKEKLVEENLIKFRVCWDKENT
jgi:hypothetical protein